MAVNDLIPLNIFFQKEKYLYHKYFNVNYVNYVHFF